MFSEPVAWFDAREWGVEGKGWERTMRYYARLPISAKSIVPEQVWNLAQHSTGMVIQFETNAEEIHARWTLSSKQLAMPHMPATSASGVDLYAWDETNNRWRWVAVAQPNRFPTTEARLTYGIMPGEFRYRLYLPLFNGVEKIEVGVPEAATFSPILPRVSPPIVVYGTSIVHGVAASRSGMSYPAILGRWYDLPVINLGFSGRGKMELELAHLLAEVDASAYIIDCLPNMPPSLVSERAAAFLEALCSQRPNTPIVIVEDRSYGNAWIIPTLGKRNVASREILQRTYGHLEKTGVPNLFYVFGSDLIGEDDEATVDGSHPTDLGFLRIAQRINRTLESISRFSRA